MSVQMKVARICYLLGALIGLAQWVRTGSFVWVALMGLTVALLISTREK